MLNNQFDETVAYLRREYTDTPTVGIILGTGMGQLAQAIEVEWQVAYNFIPYFPVSTVESHLGKLIFGRMGGKKVVAMQGRFHYYEGYGMDQIVYPVRVMKLLGVETLFVSNAAGAVNLNYKKGTLMAIEDHINLLPDNPLRGKNLDRFGPRFPDMSAPYNAALLAKAEAIAAEENLPFRKGVYVAVSGPNLETRAEYRFLNRIGADAVGMSTVPEVIAARHCGMRVFAISVLTDECDPDNLKPVTLEDVIGVATEAEPKLTRLLTRLIQES